MAHYRTTWTNENDGCGRRFDVIPFGSDISSSVVDMGAGVVVGSDPIPLQMAFDDLPFGLMTAPTMSIKLIWDNLPTLVQTAIEDMTDGAGDRNLYLFWVEATPNSGSWSVQFAGTEEQIENLDIEPDESGYYTITLNLIDALYHTMLSLKGADVFDEAASGLAFGRLWEVGSPSYSRSDLQAQALSMTNYVTLSMDTVTARTKTWNVVSELIKAKMTDYLVTFLTRTSNVSTDATVDAADDDDRIDDFADTGARFYKANTTYPRAKAASLTDTSMLLTTHLVGQSAGQVYGGLYSAGDEFSFAQAQSLLDVMKDLCETMFLKVSWSPVYTPDAGGDYIRWIWDVATTFGNKRGDTTPDVWDLTTAVSVGTLSRGAGTIGKCEVRATLASNAERNVSEWVYSDARSRAERSVNLEPILHNLPSWKDRVTHSSGEWSAMQRGIVQTNLICYEDTTNGNDLFKAHEDTRVVVRGAANGGTATTYLEVTSAEQIPNIDSDEFEEGGGIEVDPTQAAYMQGWINEIQRTTALPYALAKAYYQAFYSPKQASIEVVWRSNPLLITGAMGGVHDLQNGIADDFPSYAWGRATIVSLDRDTTAGTVTVGYLLPDMGLF